MPKHYRIVMTVYDEDNNDRVVDSDTHKETYPDNMNADRKIREKFDAARGTGRGRGQR